MQKGLNVNTAWNWTDVGSKSGLQLATMSADQEGHFTFSLLWDCYKG